MGDRCKGCRNELRPCRYKNRAITRGRCSHYVSKLSSAKNPAETSYGWLKDVKKGKGK